MFKKVIKNLIYLISHKFTYYEINLKKNKFSFEFIWLNIC